MSGPKWTLMDFNLLECCQFYVMCSHCVKWILSLVISISFMHFLVHLYNLIYIDIMAYIFYLLNKIFKMNIQHSCNVHITLVCDTNFNLY